MARVLSTAAEAFRPPAKVQMTGFDAIVFKDTIRMKTDSHSSQLRSLQQ
jgi:hypothetical protein